MNPIQTIAKNTVFLFLADVFGKICWFTLSLLVARTIGVLAFGDYSFAIDFTFLFVSLAIFGFNSYITREIAAHREKARPYIANILSMKIVLSFLAFCLLVLIIGILPYPKEVKWITIVIGLAGIINTFTLFFRSIFVAYEQMGYDAMLNIIEKGLFLFLGMGAIFGGYGLKGLGIAYLTTMVVSLLVSYIICRKLFVVPTWGYDFILWKMIFIAALPFIGTSFFGMLYLKLNTVMLSLLQDNAAVGFYNAGYQIIDGLRLIPIIFIYALFPAISRFAINSKEKLLFATKKAIKYIALCAFPIAIGGIVVAKQLIPFIYGSAFAPTTQPFQVLLGALSFIFITRPLYLGLLAIDKQIINLYLALTAIILTILLNLFFIPRYGLLGAAITLTLVEGTLLIMSYYFFRKYVASIDWRKLLSKPLCAALLMGIIVFWIKAVVIAIITGIVIYPILLLATRSFDHEDKKIITQLLSR